MRLSSAVLVAFLCFLGLSASRCSSDLSSSGGASLSIVAYNVKSLFDATDDGPEFPEFSVAKGHWDEVRYRLRLSNVAAAVLSAVPAGGKIPGPDILCLEEIENQKVLEALRVGPLSSARYRYAAIAPAEGGPFSDCILSRLPIISVVCHAASTTSGRSGRELLEVEVSVKGRSLILFSCHWKSKSGGAEETEEARRADAALVRSRVRARIGTDPAVELVVCGDFNESPDEFLRIERRYITALMPVEEAQLDSVRLGGDTCGASLLVASTPSVVSPVRDEIVLFSPWAEAGGYSYSFHGCQERLDGFLLSPGLLDTAGLRYKGFAVATSAFLVDAEGVPLAWPGSGASGYSDHLPVLLLLEESH
jgi:endonuclease/exonuclease/phosphatase family metal-dependent hydrolase